MYFKSRADAGSQLADGLSKYSGSNTTIIALSDGGVVVGMQIASKLHCPLTLLMTAPIELPGEIDPVAVIDQDGIFTYNNMYSPGELEEFDMEYHHYIEQLKLEKLHRLHRLMGKSGLIRKDLLRGRNIILVSDGLSTGFSLEAVVDYLKSVEVGKLIAAVPLATITAVDRMHILTDEIHCLSVVDNYIDTNHYYDDNTLPSHQAIIKMVENIVEHWR